MLPCKAKPPLLAAVCGCCKARVLSVQRDAGVRLVLSQELLCHPNISNPRRRKGKDCLQVRKKKSLVSGQKPGPLVAFQGKKLVFTPFALGKLSAHKHASKCRPLTALLFHDRTALQELPQSTEGLSPMPWPASPPQDLFGDMPVDAALQLVLAWPGLGRSSSSAQMGQAEDRWMSKSS